MTLRNLCLALIWLGLAAAVLGVTFGDRLDAPSNARSVSIPTSHERA